MTTKTVITKNEQGEIVRTKVSLTSAEVEQRNTDAANLESEKLVQDVIDARNSARGTIKQQLEYIAENGIQAWLEREYEIRSDNLKPNQSKPNMKNPKE